MGPSDVQLTYAFAYITYALLFGGAMYGILRTTKAFMMIPKLAEPNRYPEVVPTLVFTRGISGLAFLAVNVINLSLAVSLGITQEYLYDAGDLLSYVSTNQPSNDEVALSLLVSSMLRMTGTIGLMHGCNAIGDIGHRDESVKKKANTRVFWGFICGVVLWTPEFWAELGGKYFEPLKHLSTLLKATELVSG